MDSRVESRRGIWRGVGGADRGRAWTGGEGSGARRGVPRQVAHLFRFLLVFAVAARSSSPSPPPPPPDPASSPRPGATTVLPGRRGRVLRAARAADGPARGSLARRGRPCRSMDAKRDADVAPRRARDVRHARSPDPRRVVVASQERDRPAAHAPSRDTIARGTRRAARANGGHQRASRRECRGRHRRRRRDSPLRARWGVVGPGR